MITPMMMNVDFTAIRNVGRKPAGLVVTLIVNWLVKPFSMVFVWSHLTNGEAAYTLVQVSRPDPRLDHGVPGRR
jgi:ACR3 family arsenite transporter